MDEFHELVTAEHESIKSVRDAEREIQSILQRRLHDEQNVILETPYIDVAFVKEDEILQETEGVVKYYHESVFPALTILIQDLIYWLMVSLIRLKQALSVINLPLRASCMPAFSSILPSAFRLSLPIFTSGCQTKTKAYTAADVAS
eukprot:Gb_34559 [translate_table: standard]